MMLRYFGLAILGFVITYSSLSAMGESPRSSTDGTATVESPAPAAPTATQSSSDKPFADLAKESIKNAMASKIGISAVDSEGKNVNLPGDLQITKIYTDKIQKIDDNTSCVIADFKFIDPIKKSKTLYQLEFTFQKSGDSWQPRKTVLKSKNP